MKSEVVHLFSNLQIVQGKARVVLINRSLWIHDRLYIAHAFKTCESRYKLFHPSRTWPKPNLRAPSAPSTPSSTLSKPNLILTRVPQAQGHNLKPQSILLNLIIRSHQKAIKRCILVAHSARLIPPLRHKACAQACLVWCGVVIEARTRFDAIRGRCC